ncbi:orotate phosphoribosyltransferase [Atopobium deltae]|uniref:Orotate phosphoribosyltransferase n=2 Tax=Atopobium deltae TaxID=1393034 RepID=A0A133XXL4_9ACTN|nr:orotate phosphoribosyltransferase [Atopobium deltae]
MVMASSAQIAEALLSIKAVFLRPNEPFTWASGIKSPIYCDNRLILSYPETRQLIEQAIADTIAQRYPATKRIMGTATAGIAHAALVAERLGLPMGYVRGSAKDHGRKNQIEGRIEPGDKIVVVEDLISTAGSVLDCVHPLREAGAEVVGIVSIFTYGMQKGLDRLAAEKITNTSLCDLDALVDVAVAKNYIKAEDKRRLLAFRDNPSDESWMTCA